MNFILYRQYDSDDNLLYIGISLTVFERISQHKVQSEWFHRICKITLERFKSREQLCKAEKAAIRKEKPLFNKHFSESNRIKTKPVLNVTKAAEYLDIPRRTFYLMLKDGRFDVPPIKGTNPRLWNIDALEAWRAAQ